MKMQCDICISDENVEGPTGLRTICSLLSSRLVCSRRPFLLLFIFQSLPRSALDIEFGLLWLYLHFSDGLASL